MQQGEKMRFGPVVFQEDTELTEPFTSVGPTTAKGNLAAYSIKTNGALIVKQNLDIESKLEVNGPLIVNGTFSCFNECKAKINGPVTIKKGIIGGFLHVNGPIKAKYIDATDLGINGPVTVEGDIQATDEIKFGVGYSNQPKNFDIGGVIEAPIVHFKNHGRSGDQIPGFRTIKKVLGLTSSSEKITLEGLKIKTKLLRLEGVEIINSEIDTDETEDL